MAQIARGEQLTFGKHSGVTETSPELVQLGASTVTTFAGAEPAGTVDAFDFEDSAAVVPLVHQRISHIEAVLGLDRAPICTNTKLRENCDLMCECLSPRPCLALGNDVLAEADPFALLGHHLASRQYELEGPAFPYESRQPDRAPIDKRDTPAAAVHAEVGGLFHDPEVGPHRQLHPTSNCGPCDCGNDRLVELKATGPHGSHRDVTAIAVVAAVARDRKLRQRLWLAERSSVFQIPTSTEGATFTPKDRNRGLVVCIEFEERVVERCRTLGVHGVARLGPGVDDRPHVARLLDSNTHATTPRIGSNELQLSHRTHIVPRARTKRLHKSHDNYTRHSGSMDLATTARTLNEIGYGYIGSWALLTACEERVFDRLPATVDQLVDAYPDPNLVTTWFRVLEELDVLREDSGLWSLSDAMSVMLTGDESYSDYLGGQILQQMVPRLTLGSTGRNELTSALRDPQSRSGYDGWFADAAEANAYQRSQFAGSVGPARALAKRIPEPEGPVFDLGGGWGAMANAIADRHGVDVDVVDLEPVVNAAPRTHDQVNFHSGSALDATTWPSDRNYDGAVLSYLFSSVPGSTHSHVLDGLQDANVSWVAVHDFFLDSGAHALSWSLQHAVFVPGHTSRTTSEVSEELAARGWTTQTTHPLVDEMTSLVVACQP